MTLVDDNPNFILLFSFANALSNSERWMVKLLPDKEEINSSASLSFSCLFISTSTPPSELPPHFNRNRLPSPELTLLLSSETVMGKFDIPGPEKLDPYRPSLNSPWDRNFVDLASLTVNVSLIPCAAASVMISAGGLPAVFIYLPPFKSSFAALYSPDPLWGIVCRHCSTFHSPYEI